MFSKILIANRGEIACRIIQTARKLGVGTVAVYSDADGMHGRPLWVEMADEAVPIGPRNADLGVEPYLIAERIINAALTSGAEAIHPGYGFLSENPDFVEQVEKAGLIFIGPSAESIRAMGLKDAAKKLMQKAGVPVVPGYHGSKQDVKFLTGEADKIGYPVLIKARAGGGGKGMRRVDEPKDFKAALEGAVREGMASFGDGRVLIEKYITAPRHIEIQVFGDNHGNVVHLFERDCSLQRRHQKVIEEAPAPGMTAEMRDAMTDAAVRAAKAINYSGAGTIEFIVDGSDGLTPDGFWFMEMNTRLQVEHPVTEAITGIDLVEWQLRIASGEQLPCKQSDLAVQGHAIEARLYAEDVAKGFLPVTGRLDHLVFSDIARNDSGVRPGDTITPFYDPMIAKVIVHDKDRHEALAGMRTALRETRIAGTVTNLEFLLALMNHRGFAKGELDTGLIDRDMAQLLDDGPTPYSIEALAAIISSGLLASPTGLDPFDLVKNHVHWQHTATTARLLHREDERVVRITPQQGGGWSCDDQQQSIHFEQISLEEQIVRYGIGGEVESAGYFANSSLVALFVDGKSYSFKIPDPLSREKEIETGGDNINAPMSGLVKQVSVKKGAEVTEGDPLIVLEAMKMEHTLTAPRNGVVAELTVNTGEQVDEGALLLALEVKDEADG